MAGIYIHIPFCKQACHYCNFHFSTSMKQKNDMLQAIIKEIALTKQYLEGQEVQTVYLGGGTPSVLSAHEINKLFNQLYKYHSLAQNAEITLEANPDDLNQQKIKELKETPINRFSIGIQSFQSADLALMNRAHNVAQAHNCIRQAQQAGFYNLTIDLIYGIPGLSEHQWYTNLKTAFAYQIPHISAYCLTVEPKTALAHFVKTGQIADVNEQEAAKHFAILIEEMAKAGYEHYEISNFAQAGHYAIHNSNYWRGKAYLGIGPSAHSYNGAGIRRWNIANNAKYIKAIQQQLPAYQEEVLSPTDQFNEYIMTSLRTNWGCDLKHVKQQFGSVLYQYLLKTTQTYIVSGKILHNTTTKILTLSPQAKFIADGIISDLFFIDN